MAKKHEVSFITRNGLVFYYCNGQVPECKKSGCYLRGGECHSTSRIAYATTRDSILTGGGDTDGET